MIRQLKDVNKYNLQAKCKVSFRDTVDGNIKHNYICAAMGLPQVLEIL